LVERRQAVSALPAPSVEIPPHVGFASGPPHQPELIASVVSEVQRLRADIGVGETDGEKPYLLERSIGAAPPPAILEFATDPGIVGVASRYLGLVPTLTAMTILVSPHMPGPLTGSQLFHCDWEAVRQVKVFVNCTAVADENGPLTAATAAASSRVKAHVGYRYGGPSFRLSDNEVDELVAQEEVRAFAGPAGTVTFIDTSSCLHFGSRVREGAGERLVLQLQYLTPAAFDLVLRGEGRRPFAGRSGVPDPVERLVLGTA